MNQAQVKKELESLPASERSEYLLSIGFPEKEIPDFLYYLFSHKRPKHEKSKPDPLKYRTNEPAPKARPLSETLARCEALMERMRQNPQPETTQAGFTPFERDVLHNRHLLGGQTILDTASFHSPELRQTETIRWFVNDFIPSSSHFAMVFGGTGSGKTFASLAYINRIANVEMGIGSEIKKTNAAYIHAYRLSEMVNDRKKHGDKLDELTRNTGILLIDDVGTEPTGFKGGDFLAFFEYLIGERHKFRKKTIMTSNTTAEKFKELYGERIVSRFNQIGLFLETKDPDWRTQ